MRSKLLKLFKNGINSVDPASLIKNNVKINSNLRNVEICDQLFENYVNFHVLGFGKAVLPMAISLQSLLKTRIKSGILSIPIIREQIDIAPIKVIQGAENNLPDENSVKATDEIIRMARAIPKEDVVFVLISGGGSSLLCKPANNISLYDKLQTIKMLVSSGANIRELNSVRKCLSQVKGGKLGKILQNNKTICLVLSDVIGNPLDVIASGPMIKNTDSMDAAMDVVRKYKLELKIPKHVMNIIKQESNDVDLNQKNIIHKIIGSNEIALKTIINLKDPLTTKIMLSSKIEGLVRDVSKSYLELSKYIIKYLNSKDGSSIQNLRNWIRLNSSYQIENDFLNNLLVACENTDLETLVILMGGETTVELYGSGKGGRNQELAVLFAQGLYTMEEDLFGFNINILCGGTDGIDGPTDAAGAIGSLEMIKDGIKIGLNVEEYLRNNDTYSYLSQIANGEYLIKVGHTGTNVMDIHMIAISKKSSQEVTI